MGPKILEVPILLGLAYVGMGYLYWTVARAMMGVKRNGLTGWRFVTLPLLASGVMTAWDVAMDPIWSTVGHLWIWKQGGGFFGVPVTNYFGWLLTNYVICLLFVLLVQRESGRNENSEVENVPLSYWRIAVMFYAITAAGNLMLGIPTPRHPVVSDAAGTAWRVSDITTACAVASLFPDGRSLAVGLGTAGRE
jgi:uncharacterized membrane protein